MLSKKCQYALHALICIASRNESPTQVVEICRTKNIPRKFLEVILLELKNGGILVSKKGKGGGYSLKRPANTISVIEIIRHIDGAVAMIPCVSLHYYQSCGMCADENNCAINQLFSTVRDQTIQVLSSTLLSDLIQSQSLPNLPSPWHNGNQCAPLKIQE
jgi:Rrf2 family protein